MGGCSLSTAQAPVPVPRSRQFCGLGPMGAKCSLSSMAATTIACFMSSLFVRHGQASGSNRASSHHYVDEVSKYGTSLAPFRHSENCTAHQGTCGTVYHSRKHARGGWTSAKLNHRGSTYRIACRHRSHRRHLQLRLARLGRQWARRESGAQILGNARRSSSHHPEVTCSTAKPPAVASTCSQTRVSKRRLDNVKHEGNEGAL